MKNKKPGVEQGLAAALKSARGRVMTPKEREDQMVDFVFGNLLESSKGSRKSVRTHLGLGPRAASVGGRR